MNKAIILFAILMFFSCDSTKKIAEVPVVEYEDLDTLFVSAPPMEPGSNGYELPKYNPSFTRTQDLLHTKLDLSFDWEQEAVIGKSWLKMRPFFYPADILALDAKGFEIHKVMMNGKELKYDYNGLKLEIQLGKLFESGQEYEVYIEYTAYPKKTETHSGQAILSDQGLFFINADGSEANKPQQIWTQGETENNSRWFPTIDKPNERCTQEVTVTVDDKFTTLSNGLLVSSKKNPDGTRTDYWNMDQPHAPYLFMLGIGEYAVVKDKWKDIELTYYVEPKYEQDAKAIFSNTKEMMTFFSDFTGVEYPWQKYAQIVVRDYVSGAMENTTSVIFGEFVQRTTRELLDDHNERIVAHELVHHWFGDLVTCESWANLTMNEGFANYGEYLWFEHKYGKDEADNHLLTELNGYLASCKSGIHPLIHFEYDDKEHMFDAHSYNKGGLVLHMLRHHVGDKAFRAGLKRYLNENEYTAVEAHDLRLAFEDVTGLDLNWFFDQWYFSAGHPVLDISYEYDEVTKKQTVLIEQTQNPETNPPIFQLPLAVDIYVGESGVPRREEIMVNQRKQRFVFDVAEKPKLVNVDADRVLLGEVADEKSDQSYLFQYRHAPQFRDRIEAIRVLAKSSLPEAKDVMVAALNDKHWSIRAEAVNQVQAGDKETEAILAKLAENDPKSQVRALALRKLAMGGDNRWTSVAQKVIDKDQSYLAIAAALEALAALDPVGSLAYAQKLEKEESGEVVNVIGQIYSASGDTNYLSFFENNFEKVDGYDAMSFFGYYMQLIARTNPQIIAGGMEKLKGIAVNMGQSPWRRFAATKSINDMRGAYQAEVPKVEGENKTALLAYVESITKMIDEIKAKETNDELQMFYKSF